MTDEMMLTVALENVGRGAHMAGAYVDPEDGTATIELLERIPVGWKNITLDGALTTSRDMAEKFDDLVLTREASLDDAPSDGSEPSIGEWAARAYLAREKAIAKGYTPDHDAKHGIRHLLHWASDYARRGRAEESSGLILSALALLDAEPHAPTDEEREALLRDLYTLRSNTGGPVLRRIEIVDRAMAAISGHEAQQLARDEDEFAPGECDGSGTCSAPRHVHGCYTRHRADQCDSPDEYGHLTSEPEGEPSEAHDWDHMLICRKCDRGMSASDIVDDMKPCPGSAGGV